MRIFTTSLFLLLFYEVGSSEVELKPNYTSINWDVSYVSGRHHQGGYDGFVEGYYKFVGVVVDLILPDALPDGLFVIEPGETLLSHVQGCIWAYRRLLIFVVILVVQIVFLIFSSIQALCSCLCSCTKETTLTPSRSRKFRRWLWLTWIFATLFFLLLMLVLANQSNQNMDEGVDTVVLTLEDTMVDIGTFAGTTVKQLQILLLTNLDDYLNFFISSGARVTAGILRDLGNTIGASDFTKILNDILENFNLIKPVFDEIEAVLTEVENLGKMINKEISELKNMVENMICSTKECEKLKGFVTSLESIYDGGANVVNETYAELEDLTNQGTHTVNEGVKEVGNLTSLIGGEVLKGGKTLGKLTSKIAGNVVEGLEKTGKDLTNLTGSIVGGLGKEIKKDGKALKDVAGEVVTGVGDVAGGVGDVVGDTIDDVFGGKKKKPKATTTPTPVVEGLEKTAKNLTGSIVGGLGKEIKKDGKALKDVAGEVVTGVGDVAGGVGDAVGDTIDDVFGGKKKKPKTTTTPTPVRKKKKPGVIENVVSDIGGIFDGTTKERTAKNSTNPVSPEPRKKKEEQTSTTPSILGGVKTETSNIFESFNTSTPEKKGKVEESTMDLTSFLDGGSPSKNATTDKAKTSKTEDILGGSDKNKDKEQEEKTVETTTTSKPEIKTQKSEIEHLATGVSKGVEKVQNVASEVAGGIADTANEVGNGIGDVIGGFRKKRSSTTSKDSPWGFDDWSSMEPDKGEKKVGNEETVTLKNGFNTFFGGGNSKSGVLNEVKEEAASGVENKISDASNKLINMGGNFFGFRKKRGISFNIGLKKEFDMIFDTIDTIENFIMNDLKNLNNVSALLSPVVEEIEGVIKEVFVEVETELKEAAKPIEKLFNSTLDKIISIEHSILNATNVIKDAQGILSGLEVYRYHTSNLIAAALLISFTLLTLGISVRMVYNNSFTKCTYKGGFFLLHLTALLMAIASLIYIGAGVTSQKVLCDTLDTNQRENNIMKILNRINPEKYGLLLDLNVHKVIVRCHQDKSLYEVTALKTILNIEKVAVEFFDIKSIEKEFDSLLGLQFNFSKYLNLDIIRSLDVDLNFGAFDELLDLPIFNQIETMQKEFTNIPLAGPLIKTIAGNVDTYKHKVMSMKAPIRSGKDVFSSFFANLMNMLTSVENVIIEMERMTVGTVQNVVLHFKNILVSTLMDYVNNRLIYSIQHKVGKCKPISAAFNTTLDSVCGRITTPANGHWFSWFIGVFLAILLIVTSRVVDGKLNRIGREKTMNKNYDEIELKSIKKNKLDVENEAVEKQSDAL